MAETAGARRTFTQERLAQDVADVLYVEADEVDPEDSLLDQGLDSIRLMTLLEKWRADGADVGFADLAERPTLRAWAVLLDPAGADDRASA
ncbi:phosphopantetheine attachment domain protein [Streptomyces solincola]|uniref:Phosphopantetheine attachment domain protein n=1 Tax=Streptomyces solincola TaxID=2100817 RepID=A0A2S9PMZ7_9ACTN|nr:phosphopantetheine-binding protein [Streptomyces solincola]PRH75781.1 phosphopantetheine attachment domain protein [Streptomyces solincola]